ncbi:MAG: hypothetical protein U5R06_03675 [candidate division KSB1 bacterium]|nr:hypothetical protein [candidate division KSB1 bacterium]
MKKKRAPLGAPYAAHGFSHRDLLNKKGKIRKTPLFNQDYNDALLFAESDLKDNWRIYKHRFLGDIRPLTFDLWGKI